MESAALAEERAAGRAERAAERRAQRGPAGEGAEGGAGEGRDSDYEWQVSEEEASSDSGVRAGPRGEAVGPRVRTAGGADGRGGGTVQTENKRKQEVASKSKEKGHLRLFLVPQLSFVVEKKIEFSPAIQFI